MVSELLSLLQKCPWRRRRGWLLQHLQRRDAFLADPKESIQSCPEILRQQGHHSVEEASPVSGALLRNETTESGGSGQKNLLRPQVFLSPSQQPRRLLKVQHFPLQELLEKSLLPAAKKYGSRGGPDFLGVGSYGRLPQGVPPHLLRIEVQLQSDIGKNVVQDLDGLLLREASCQAEKRELVGEAEPIVGAAAAAICALSSVEKRASFDDQWPRKQKSGHGLYWLQIRNAANSRVYTSTDCPLDPTGSGPLI